jgi:hypothetical protein
MQGPVNVPAGGRHDWGIEEEDMGFADRYIQALGASNLRNDARHRQVDPLMAAAFAAAESKGDIGLLLYRVKYADSLAAKAFEGNAANLAQLLRLWTAEVGKRGRARRWVPENTAWDAQAAQKLYRTVAEHSLAYWLDSRCTECAGTGAGDGGSCAACAGTGEAPIVCAGGFIRERVKDMVSELHDIVATQARLANRRLRSR